MFVNYDIMGYDFVCKVLVMWFKEVGEIWLVSGDIVVVSLFVCLLVGVKQYEVVGKKVNVVYFYDKELGIKVVVDKVFYVVDVSNFKVLQVVFFLLKKDVEVYVNCMYGKLVIFVEVFGQVVMIVVVVGVVSGK